MASKRRTTRAAIPWAEWKEIKRALAAGRAHRRVRITPPTKSDCMWMVEIRGVPGHYTQGKTRRSALRNLASLIDDLEAWRHDEAMNSTSCVACAADEDRRLRLTFMVRTARALMRVVEAHERRAERGIKGDKFVSVDAVAIVAELVAREAARLRRGGRVPAVRAVTVKRFRLPREAE